MQLKGNPLTSGFPSIYNDLAVAVVFVVAALTCVPSLVYLYVLGQRGQLDSH